MAIPAALLAAGLTAGGQLLSNVWQARQADKQMKFQERMSSTSHQREVDDLLAAGLNPMLSLKGGASTPGGAMANIDDPISPAVASAMAVRTHNQELKNLREQEFLIQSQEREARIRGSQTYEMIQPLLRSEAARAAQLESSARALDAAARVDNTEAVLRALSVPGAANEARMQETLLGRSLPFLTGGARAVGSLFQPIRLRPGAR